MAAGDAYQVQSDERVERAVMRQKEAQRAVRLACFVVLAIWRWWHGFICSGNAPLCGGRLGVWTQRKRGKLSRCAAAAGELVSIDTQRANLETLKQQNLYSARYGLSGRRIGLCGRRGACAGGIEE